MYFTSGIHFNDVPDLLEALRPFVKNVYPAGVGFYRMVVIQENSAEDLLVLKLKFPHLQWSDSHKSKKV